MQFFQPSNGISQPFLAVYPQIVLLDRYLQDNLLAELKKRTVIRRYLCENEGIRKDLSIFGNVDEMTDADVALIHYGVGGLTREQRDAQGRISSCYDMIHQKEDKDLRYTYLCETGDLLNAFFDASLNFGFLGNIIRQADSDLSAGIKAFLGTSYTAYTFLINGISKQFPFLAEICNECWVRLVAIKIQILNIKISSSSRCEFDPDDILFIRLENSSEYNCQRILQTEMMSFFSPEGAITRYVKLMDDITELKKRFEATPDLERVIVLSRFKMQVLNGVREYYIQVFNGYFNNYPSPNDSDLRNPDILFAVALLALRFNNLGIDHHGVEKALLRFINIEQPLSPEEQHVNDCKKVLAYILIDFLREDFPSANNSQNFLSQMEKLQEKSKLLIDNEIHVGGMNMPACKFLYLFWLLKEMITNPIVNFSGYSFRWILDNLAKQGTFDLLPVIKKIIHENGGDILKYLQNPENFFDLLFRSFTDSESFAIPSPEKESYKQQLEFGKAFVALAELRKKYAPDTAEFNDELKHIIYIYQLNEFSIYSPDHDNSFSDVIGRVTYEMMESVMLRISEATTWVTKLITPAIGISPDNSDERNQSQNVKP